MFWSVLAQLVAVLLDLLTARRQPEGAKDLEIAALRHQLRMLKRRRPRPRIARWEKLALALLATKLRRVATGAHQPWLRSLVLVTPETVLRWHRDWCAGSGPSAGATVPGNGPPTRRSPR